MWSALIWLLPGCHLGLACTLCIPGGWEAGGFPNTLPIITCLGLVPSGTLILLILLAPQSAQHWGPPLSVSWCFSAGHLGHRACGGGSFEGEASSDPGVGNYRLVGGFARQLLPAQDLIFLLHYILFVLFCFLEATPSSSGAQA